MVLPALLFIKDKPPSPPSVVATKPRPQYTYRQASKVIFSNKNYIWIFIHFQLVNTCSVYGGEITTFLKQYPEYDLTTQNVASMLNCVAGIAGSLALGRILDRYRCFRLSMLLQALSVFGFIVATLVLLKASAPVWLVSSLIVLAGAPMSTISVSSYQFAAEVTYPVEEVFGVGIMNTANKLFTFGVILLGTYLHEELIIWAVLSILGVVPALLVKEDFRRLNMKDVERSRHIEETQILDKTMDEKAELQH